MENKIIKSIISRFTMTPIAPYFYDNIGGGQVWLYKDKYRVRYMAYEGFWFLRFRQKCIEQELEKDVH